MECSFVDLVRRMMDESQENIKQLLDCGADPNLSSEQRHTLREVMHVEGLRLDMLLRALTKWKGTA